MNHIRIWSYIACMQYLAIILLVLLPAIPAHATKPCVPLSQEAFIAKVLHRSDAIIRGEIIEYSDTDSFLGQITQRWTKIDVKETLHKHNPNDTLSEKITIYGWTSYNPPLFNYREGEDLILFLRKSGDDFRLTHDAWQDCVPSIWTMDNKGQLFVPIDILGNSGWMPVSVLTSLLDAFFKDAP